MWQKRPEHRTAPVADLVAHEGKSENAEGKRPESDAENVPFLRLAEIELRLPLADDFGANDKAEGAGDECDETAPEEAGIAGGVRVHGGTARCAKKFQVAGRLVRKGRVRVAQKRKLRWKCTVGVNDFSTSAGNRCDMTDRIPQVRPRI